MAPKRSKFCILDLENFRSIWPLTLEVPRENTPYSSSENIESDIVNRQSGGKTLKYVLKFYIGGTCHVISRMRNDDSALCLWAYDVWGGISRKPLEIESWIKRTTNRKWPIPSPMVTWPMTSSDPERSWSWPHCVWCQLSRKRLEIETWWQWSTYRKWIPGNQMVMWPMMSRDPERSISWPKYVWRPVSRNGCRYWLGDNRAPIGNRYMGIKWSRDRWRHVTCREPNMLRAQYHKNGLRYRPGCNGVPIGNVVWRVEWSGARCRRMCRSSYLELITNCHSTFTIDIVSWKHRKTANIIEKTSVYHTVNDNRCIVLHIENSKNDKGYVTKQHVDIMTKL